MQALLQKPCQQTALAGNRKAPGREEAYVYLRSQGLYDYQIAETLGISKNSLVAWKQKRMPEMIKPKPVLKEVVEFRPFSRQQSGVRSRTQTRPAPRIQLRTQTRRVPKMDGPMPVAVRQLVKDNFNLITGFLRDDDEMEIATDTLIRGCYVWWYSGLTGNLPGFLCNRLRFVSRKARTIKAKRREVEYFDDRRYA